MDTEINLDNISVLKGGDFLVLFVGITGKWRVVSDDFVNGDTGWESNTLVNSLLGESLLDLIINEIIDVLSDFDDINTWLDFFNG